ncbi:MAG TPA: hypothetical protein VH395_08120 [Jatrophihabitantaceae bacterium]|jgi:hypothetical protein
MRTTAIAFIHPPRKLGDPLPKGGNYKAYSFDPARAEVADYVYFLTTSGLAMRGTPPAPRVSVTRVALAATPYPSIFLSDCPTAPANWRVVAVTPGPPPTVKSSASVPPPYKAQVQMIFYKKHWGVYKKTSDTARTCSP